MNKGKQYFRHDSNAQQDERILALRMKLGWEGYGLYWAIVERLRDSKECQLSKDYNLLGFAFNVSAGKIKQVVEDFGLFTFTDDGERFYSKRLSTDMQAVSDLSQSRSEAGKKGNEKRWSKGDNDNQEDSKPIAKPSQSDRKQIAIKQNKIKEDNTTLTNVRVEGTTARRFVPPSPDEVREYARENGYTLVDPEQFVNYYASKGWVVGKAPMKSWKHAVAGWNKREQDRRPQKHPSSNADLHPGKSFAGIVEKMPFDPTLLPPE